MKTPRYKTTDACAGCGMCNDKSVCEEGRRELNDYNGVRFTSDGFDCALPVSIDSHSVCSYGCLYCFSDNLVTHRDARARAIGETSLAFIESIFSGRGGKEAEKFRSALKYDRKRNGFPTAVQLGAICDPCDRIERQQGWLIEFIRLAIKYNQPIRMSTKGNILLMPDYRKEIEKAPHLFWVAFSIITPDDEIIEQIDRTAPNATQRIRVMKMLSSIGVKTSLRFRPIMPGISDYTKKHPYAYRELIERCADAGAKAISYEVMFTPGAITIDLRRRWEMLSKISGIDYISLYKQFGRNISCNRPPYTWTENIMHAIRDDAKKNGLVVGVSDPVWKQLGETGCCCGILPDDPVFGNWQEESATNQLIISRDTGKEIYIDDVTPGWAKVVKKVDLCAAGAGPTTVYSRLHETWADSLKKNWNNVKLQRSALNYFQGAIIPVRKDENGNLVYVYRGLERKNKPNYIWHIENSESTER